MHHIHLFIFFRFEKDGLSEHQCFFDTQYFCLLSAANPLIQQSTIMLTLCTTISQFLCFSPFFRSLERPLESVCYRAQSVKVPSCKVCEVCSVCMYVNLYLCLYMCIFVCVYVCIRVCLCLCMFIYMCTASV